MSQPLFSPRVGSRQCLTSPVKHYVYPSLLPSKQLQVAAKGFINHLQENGYTVSNNDPFMFFHAGNDVADILQDAGRKLSSFELALVRYLNEKDVHLCVLTWGPPK